MKNIAALLAAVVLAIVPRTASTQVSGRVGVNGVKTAPTTMIGISNNPAPLAAPNMTFLSPVPLSPAITAPSLPAELKATDGSPVSIILNVDTPVEKKGSALDALFVQPAPAGTETVEVVGRTDASPAARLNTAPVPLAKAKSPRKKSAAEPKHGGPVHHHDLIKKEVVGAGFALIGLGAALAPFTLAMMLALPAIIPTTYLAGNALGAFLGKKLGAPKMGEIVGRIVGSIAGAAGAYALLALAPEVAIAHILLVVGALSGSLMYGFIVKRLPKPARRR